MQYNFFKPEDNAQGQLDSDIGASTLTITLQSGDGAAFPEIFRGTTTSDGTSTTMNKTGIGSTTIAVGDFIENITDGSHAFVLAVNTNSLTTTSLSGGSDNTWQNGDTYAVGRFIVTLNKRDSDGNITDWEKVLIGNRAGDILTVETGGRGYDSSTAQSFVASDYCNIFVAALHISGVQKAFAEVQEMLDLRYTKTAVDALLAARNWKDPVVVATTGAGTLATSFENGDTIDGVVLATGDRILIKDQASAIENGIYTVNASGAPTRATDFDSSSEAASSAVAVKKGTSNADTVWLCTSDNPTIGVDNIAFAQVGVTLTKASQAEAEAATDNTKYMTPLRTIQQIVEWGDVYLGKIGDAINSGDLSGNTNLLYYYPPDGKWYKYTSDVSVWYFKLALAMETGAANDTIKIMRRGFYSMSFSNINPTFSSSLTGTDVLVGNSAANSVKAFVIDNTNGAEAIVTQITVSAKQAGTPSGALLLYLVLEQQEQSNSPALYYGSSNVPQGAIIASTSIPQASFSGSYQNLTASFGASIKIPAGCKVYYVAQKTGAVDGSNYYMIQSNAQTKALNSGTQTWSGTANAGNYSLTVTSTSPVGYSVKAYTGSNGSYGLTPTNPWARPIGLVTSTTEYLFDPEGIERMTDYYSSTQTASTSRNAVKTVTCNFCPSMVRVHATLFNNGTTDLSGQVRGTIRGDTTNASQGAVYGYGGTGGSGSSDEYVGSVLATTGNAPNRTQLCLNRSSSNASPDQNKLYCVRLENGFYMYNGYPSGTNFLDHGNGGFSELIYSLEFEAMAQS